MLSNVGLLFDDLFAIFDPLDLRALFVNPAGEALLDPGRSGQLGGIELPAVLSAAEQERFQREIRPLAKLKGGWIGPVVLRNLTGREIPCKARIIEAPDAEYAGLGRLYLHAMPVRWEGADGNVIDADVLNALLETTPDRVYFKDTQSRFLRLSRALAVSLGAADAAEVAGRTDFDFFTAEHALPALQQEQEIMRTGKPLLDFEEKETHSDGRVSWVSTTKLPFHKRDGSLIGTYGISRDITEHKTVEEAMRTNLALFRAVFDGSNDAILLISENKFVNCNVRAEKMFGRDREALLKMTPVGLSAPTQPDGQSAEVAAREHIERAYERGHHEFEWLHQSADGSTFPTEVSLSTFDFRGEKIIHASIRDISDRKKVEAERREWESRLQLTSKLEAVGSLASGVAHEVNTPTQFISDNTRFLVEAFRAFSDVIAQHRELAREARSVPSLTSLLESTKAEEERCEIDYLLEEVPRCLDQSLDGLRRIAKIVGSLKEFSHPGGNEKDNADLNRGIETTVAVSRHEWKYVADVVTELDPALPKVPCVLDEINQAMLNLIVNASHAIGEANKQRGTAKGLITIRTRREAGQAIIEVQDTGTGIPEKVRDHIFEPFFTTKPLGMGTGQGLAIVQSVIVKKHKGSVRFVTEPGKGTTFILSLPLAGPTSG
jgi:PAS domain S-box-containing protein